MDYETELVAAPAVAKRLNFKTLNSFYGVLAKDPTAPRLIKLAARKHYVRRDELDAWLAGRYAAAARAA